MPKHEAPPPEELFVLLDAADEDLQQEVDVAHQRVTLDHLREQLYRGEKVRQHVATVSRHLHVRDDHDAETHSIEEYEQFFWQKLSKIEGVQEISSSISMSQTVNTTRLPLRVGRVKE